ncbi:MAG TPA: hypothetical protein P5545_08735, partial [Bacteroidota bacterium]|nr:hypothetical protein [Bacteroidota bacterium]
ILKSTIESDKAELEELQNQLNNPEIENKDELIQKNEILLSKINEKEKRIKETLSRLKGLGIKEEE